MNIIKKFDEFRNMYDAYNVSKLVGKEENEISVEKLRACAEELSRMSKHFDFKFDGTDAEFMASAKEVMNRI